MGTMTTERCLLANLEDCQWQALRMLADAAEERGDAERAVGYRWLAEKHRWPTMMWLGTGLEIYYWRGWRGNDGEPAYLPTEMVSRVNYGDQFGRKSLAALMKATAQVAGRWLGEMQDGEPPWYGVSRYLGNRRGLPQGTRVKVVDVWRELRKVVVVPVKTGNGVWHEPRGYRGVP